MMGYTSASMAPPDITSVPTGNRCLWRRSMGGVPACRCRSEAPRSTTIFRISSRPLISIGGVLSSSISTSESAGQSMLVPVSYTHLRAHETRHDLVCRLLLEKKKKKKNQKKLHKQI